MFRYKDPGLYEMIDSNFLCWHNSYDTMIVNDLYNTSKFLKIGKVIVSETFNYSRFF